MVVGFAILRFFMLMRAKAKSQDRKLDTGVLTPESQTPESHKGVRPFIEENILSPITALLDMVRHAGENGSRKPGHLGRLSEEIIKVCVPFIREDYHRRQ